MIYATSGYRNCIYSHPRNTANFTLLKRGEPRIILKSRWLLKLSLVCQAGFLPLMFTLRSSCMTCSDREDTVECPVGQNTPLGQSLVGALPCQVLFHFHCLWLSASDSSGNLQHFKRPRSTEKLQGKRWPQPTHAVSSFGWPRARRNELLCIGSKSRESSEMLTNTLGQL